jgi:hypothetical protein
MKDMQKKGRIGVLVRNFAIELLIYGVLVVGYSLVIFRWLSDHLGQLFHWNLTIYAFAALGLIVAQGVLLDLFTSLLLDVLNLDRLE